MKKKNNTIYWILGIIILIVLFSNQDKINNLNLTESTFTEKEKANTNLGSNLGLSTNNICQELLSYVLLFDLQNLCNKNGGTWICTQNNIGCYNLNNNVINCDLTVIQTALNQCKNINANSHCDNLNVYCKY